MNHAAASKTAIILTVIAAIESGVILLDPKGWLSASMRGYATVGALAWTLAAVVTVGYIVYAVMGLPAVARLITVISPFKLLAIVIAVPSAILEEVFFRHSLMDLLNAMHQPIIVQVLLSAIAFGIVHAFWGVRGGLGAMLGAVRSTFFLGVALGIVYLAAGRIVFPCVVAHFAINLVLEPWLLYAYIERAQRKLAIELPA